MLNSRFVICRSSVGSKTREFEFAMDVFRAFCNLAQLKINFSKITREQKIFKEKNNILNLRFD